METYVDDAFSLPIEKDPSPTRDRTSALAVLSLVSGIAGLTVLPLVGGLVAIPTALSSLREIRESGDRIEGRAIARAGLWLGVMQVALALIIGLVVMLFLVRAASDADVAAARPAPSVWRGPATAELKTATPIPSDFARPPVRGVKMINEMTAADFAYIAENKIEAKQGDILACFRSGLEVSRPEFALLTRQQLIYLKEGRQTVFDLKDVAGLKDDQAYELAYQTRNVGGALQTDADPAIYHIEVRARDGARMRIEVVPPKDGPLYFDALKSAVEAAGGSPAQ